MKLYALIAAAVLAAPASAQTKEELTLVYAYVVGTAGHCNVPLNMAKAGEYAADFALDAEEVGKQTWEAQQLVYALEGQALADWCKVVADSVVELGLKP